MPPELSHLDEKGRARMVEVGEKPETAREAVARGRLTMKPATLRLIMEGGLPKGDVLGTARIAGVMAAKRCADLIPMCHPLRLTSVEVRFAPVSEDAVSGDALAEDAGAGEGGAGEGGEEEAGAALEIEATVRARDRTGVEMEAMTAAAVAGLTVYDMCKAVDREMTLSGVRLVMKRGGKSGTFIRPGENAATPGY